MFSIICSSSIFASLIANDEITPEHAPFIWYINQTGVETVLNVSIIEIPNQSDHIIVCIDKPTTNQITELRKSYSIQELKKIPIEIISNLSINSEIFSTKSSFDFSKSDSKFCTTFWWTKPLTKNTMFKIGKNSITVIGATSYKLQYSQPLIRMANGTLIYAYGNSLSDATFRYSNDNGDTWTNPGWSFSGTTTSVSPVVDDNQKVYLMFIDTSLSPDQVVYVNLTAHLEYAADGIMTTDASYNQGSHQVAAENDDSNSGTKEVPVVISTEATSYDVKYKELDKTQSEIHTNMNTIAAFPDTYGCIITTGWDRGDLRFESNRICENSAAGWVNIEAYGNRMTGLSMSNGTLLLQANGGTPTQKYYRSNNNGSSWTGYTSPLGLAASPNRGGLLKTSNDSIIIFAADADKNLRMAISHDGAKSWTNLTNPTEQATYFFIQGDYAPLEGTNEAQDTLNIVMSNTSDGYTYFFQYVIFDDSTPPGPSCTCPGAGNNWMVDMSNHCEITSDCTGLLDIDCNGTGYIDVKADIECDTFSCDITSTKQWYIYPSLGGSLQVDI
jgi:hypothetical protein